MEHVARQRGQVVKLIAPLYSIGRGPYHHDCSTTGPRGASCETTKPKSIGTSNRAPASSRPTPSRSPRTISRLEGNRAVNPRQPAQKRIVLQNLLGGLAMVEGIDDRIQRDASPGHVVAAGPLFN